MDEKQRLTNLMQENEESHQTSSIHIWRDFSKRSKIMSIQCPIKIHQHPRSSNEFIAWSQKRSQLVKETIVVDKLGVWHDTVSYYNFSSHGPSVSWSQIKFWKFAPEGQIPKWGQVFSAWFFSLLCDEIICAGTLCSVLLIPEICQRSIFACEITQKSA